MAHASIIIVEMYSRHIVLILLPTMLKLFLYAMLFGFYEAKTETLKI